MNKKELMEELEIKQLKIDALQYEIFVQKTLVESREGLLLAQGNRIRQLEQELVETNNKNSYLKQKNMYLTLVLNNCGCTSTPKYTEEVLDTIAKKMVKAIEDRIDKEIIKKPDKPMLKYEHCDPEPSEFIFYSKKQWNEMISNLMWRIADQPKIDNEWALCSIPNLCDCQKDKINKLIDERVGTTIRNIIDIVAENKKK